MSITEDRHAELLAELKAILEEQSAIRDRLGTVYEQTEFLSGQTDRIYDIVNRLSVKIDAIVTLAQDIHAQVGPVVETVRTKGIMSLLTMRH